MGVPGNNISSAKFDGTDIRQTVTLSEWNTFDMETDFYKNEIYWGEGYKVKKAKTDGTGLQNLYTASGTIGGLKHPRFFTTSGFIKLFSCRAFLHFL